MSYFSNQNEEGQKSIVLSGIRMAKGNQMVLTLEAGYLFNLSDDTVSMTFKTWLIFLYKKLGSKEWRRKLFVKFDDLPKPLPDCFLEGGDILNKVRVVIDTTSIKVISF